LPEAAKRYLEHAIAPGTKLAPSILQFHSQIFVMHLSTASKRGLNLLEVIKEVEVMILGEPDNEV
jgi:hypothetical protein